MRPPRGTPAAPLLLLVLLVLLVAAAASPAPAAPLRRPGVVPAAGTSTLSVSAPATADLGRAATTAGSLSGSLGQVTVTESSSAGVLRGWTTTVTATPFTTTSGTMSRSIELTQVQYVGGALTSTGVALGNCATSPVAQTLAAPRVAYSCGSALTVGTSVVRWNPTLSVSFPSSTVAGTYRGTITHSVS